MQARIYAGGYAGIHAGIYAGIYAKFILRFLPGFHQDQASLDAECTWMKHALQ